MPNTSPKSEDVIDAEFEPVNEAEQTKPKRKRAAWPLVWSLFVLATFFGAALGALGARFLVAAPVSSEPSDTKWAAQFESVQERVKEQSEELANIQKQLDAIAADTAAPMDLELLADLQSRLDALEARLLANFDANGKATFDFTPILDRLAALENTVHDPVDISAQGAQINDMINRLQVLENGAPTLGDPAMSAELLTRLQKLETKRSGQENQGQQQMALANLKLAAAGPKPFSTELMAARSSFADADTFGVLLKIAPTGAPTLAQLKEQFHDLIPGVLRIANAPAKDASLRDKAKSALGTLVFVRRIDGKGDGVQAQLAKVEMALNADDLTAAIAMAQSINGQENAPLHNWLQSAQNRSRLAQVLFQLPQEQKAGAAK